MAHPIVTPPILTQLPVQDDTGGYLAVVEAKAGSRNKYKYDPKFGALTLHRVLPLGTSFPYSFGFIPSTLGEDGDPLDVVLFMDEPAEPGTVVPCRLAGMLEATQTERGKKAVRNDRLLAIGLESPQYTKYRDIGDFSSIVLEELERFFTFYNEQDGKVFKTKRQRGKEAARKAVEKGRKLAKKASAPSS
jgi:inorganic pyrophosphatase